MAASIVKSNLIEIANLSNVQSESLGTFLHNCLVVNTYMLWAGLEWPGLFECTVCITFLWLNMKYERRVRIEHKLHNIFRE